MKFINFVCNHFVDHRLHCPPTQTDLCVLDSILEGSLHTISWDWAEILAVSRQVVHM